MSETPNPRPSSLDPEMLRILEAAQAGLASPLLDDAPLIESDVFDENAPLIPEGEQGGERVSPEAVTDAAPSDARDTPLYGFDTPAVLADAIQVILDTPLPGLRQEPPGSMEENVPADALQSEEWLEEDVPLAQFTLDEIVAAEIARRNTGQSGDVGSFSPEVELPEASWDTDRAPAIHSRPPGAPGSEQDARPMSQAEPDVMPAAQSPVQSTPAPVDSGDAGSGSEDAHDVRLTGDNTAAPSPGSNDDDGPMSQAELDALLAAESEPESPASSMEPDAPLSHDDLDALFAAYTAQPAAPASENDLDAMLAGEASSTSKSTTLSQEELDALFAAASGIAAARESAPAPPDAERPMDQNNFDALLSGIGEEHILGGSPLDAAVASAGDVLVDDISLSQSSIDSLMADFDRSGALVPNYTASDATSAGPGEDDDEISEISQDMIDALIANAQAQSGGGPSQAAVSEVGAENYAAAATASDTGPDLLSQNDLDRLIEESRQQDKERDDSKQRAVEEVIAAAQFTARAGAATQPEPADAAIDTVSRRLRQPGVVLPFLRDNALRVAASLLMGGLAAVSTGVLLHLNREASNLNAGPSAGVAFQVALERAEDEMIRGDYVAAIDELEGAMASAIPGPARDDAAYLLLEAQYRAFRGEFGSDAFDEMLARIDKTVEQAGAHPRAPEALYWKAQLLTSNMPLAALDTYNAIFEQYAEAAGMDRMLLDAARLALAQNDPLASTVHAQELLQRFPGSRWAGEAVLIIADANVKAGNEQDARTTYVRIAEAEPDSGLGAQAFMRLGRLAYDSGQYDQAIEQLSRRLETTTTLEGNDEVYLLLARAYRQAGQLNEARDTLNDLLNIFEPGPVTPDAYIEYSKVLDALGEREKAVKMAQRAALEYPQDPDVLRNSGELFGLSGNPLAAAGAYVAADNAGAADPNLLLSAARYYRAASMPEEAANTYELVQSRYGSTPAALAGGIEAAQLRYEQGAAEAALDDLKALQATTQGTEYYLGTLRAMQHIYKELGLTDHILATGREIIQVAEEPEILAQTAIELIDTGDLESAQNAIERIDLAHLKQGTAFDLLMKEGHALLSVAPQRGLDKMEMACFNYPEARTREADQLLLRTYLATGRSAAARRMVMELKASVAEKRMDTPYLVDAAISWGDYLYENEDYRTAEFAYAMAEEAGLGADGPVAGLRTHPDWARYQRANALLRLADYEGCLALFDKIAASDSPWAGEAGVKAKLARLEQRQRGIDVPPAPQTPEQTG